MFFVLSPAQIVLVVLIYSLAATVQSSTGFGSTVIAGPFLLLIHPQFAPGPFVLAGLSIAALVMLRDGVRVPASEIMRLTTARVVGSALGALLLLRLSQDGLTVAFSALLIAAVIASVLGVKTPRSRPAMCTAGVISGVMGVVAGLGGTPVAIYFQNDRGAELRSKLAALLFPGGVVSLVAISLAGRFSRLELQLYLLLVPSIIIGHLVSTFLKRFVDRHVSKWMVLTIAAGGSGWLLVKTVLNS